MYKQSKVSDINIHHFGFRFSGLVPIRDVAAASLLALYAVCNSRAPVCIPKPARARRASTVASRRCAMALGAGAAAARRARAKQNRARTSKNSGIALRFIE